MAFKLDKAAQAERARFVQMLTDSAEKLQEALEDYNGALEEAARFATGIASGAQAEVDEKSERWLESGAGQAATSWIETWDEIASGLEAVDIELGHAETLAEGPDSPET